MKKPVSKAKSGSYVFEVLWGTKALEAVNKIYEYILQNSFQGAEIFKEGIFDAVESLKINPERFPADRDLKNPCRWCLVWSYRIIFRVTLKDNRF